MPKKAASNGGEEVWSGWQLWTPATPTRAAPCAGPAATVGVTAASAAASTSGPSIRCMREAFHEQRRCPVDFT